MDRSDLLTWQGLRALADTELLVSRETVRGSADGPIVFAMRAWQGPYRSQWLPQVTRSCVLVTAFHDVTITAQSTAAMFASPVRRWFGVQAVTRHPQLTAMPIGVDGRALPVLQAAERRTTRDVLLYVNVNVDRRIPPAVRERMAVWRQFSGQPWAVAERHVALPDYCAMLGRSQFVVSPRGNAWDCYRTYEAIAMGAIPIVRRCPPASDVCEGLPVLLVDDWREVTPERLRREWDVRRGDTRPITMSYWRERIMRWSDE